MQEINLFILKIYLPDIYSAFNSGGHLGFNNILFDTYIY